MKCISVSTFFNFLTYIICTIGALYQTYELFSNYFDYEMTTVIKIIMPSDRGPLTTNICYQFDVVVNPHGVRRQLGMAYRNDSTREEDVENYKLLKSSYNMTPAILFDITFDYYDLFTNPTTAWSWEKRGRRYYMYYNSKMIKQVYMCYHAIPEYDSKYFLAHTTKSLKKDNLDQFTYYFLSNDRNKPWRGWEAVHKGNEAYRFNIVNNTCLYANGYSVKKTSPPRPYENCAKYNTDKLRYEDENDCLIKCLDEYTMRNYNMSYHGNYFYEGERTKYRKRKKKKKPSYIFERDNRTIFPYFSYSVFSSKERKDFDRYEKLICSDKCPRLGCDSMTVFSIITKQKCIDGYYSNEDFKMVFIASQSIIPSFEVDNSPKIYSFEFFFFLFGTLGTWFGLSMLSFNPYDICCFLKSCLKRFNRIDISEPQSEPIQNIAQLIDIDELTGWIEKTNNDMKNLNDNIESIISKLEDFQK